MEVTSKDKKHIEQQVEKTMLRIQSEATEYANLCEVYYYEQLLNRVQIKLDVCRTYPQDIKRVYNS